MIKPFVFFYLHVVYKGAFSLWLFSLRKWKDAHGLWDNKDLAFPFGSASFHWVTFSLFSQTPCNNCLRRGWRWVSVTFKGAWFEVRGSGGRQASWVACPMSKFSFLSNRTPVLVRVAMSPTLRLSPGKLPLCLLKMLKCWQLHVDHSKASKQTKSLFLLFLLLGVAQSSSGQWDVGGGVYGSTLFLIKRWSSFYSSRNMEEQLLTYYNCKGWKWYARD